MIVRDAVPAERDNITALINLAFFDLAANRHLVADPRRRWAVLGAYFAIHVDHALRAGTARVADDDGRVAGVALWYDAADPGPDGYDTALVAAVGADRADRFRAFDRSLHAGNPTVPHAYLGFLAVPPRRQSNGTGSLLLADGHAELDHHALAAYLVASGRRSRELYLRHGYADHGDPIEVADAVLMYPMLRPARIG